jgi:hypothetical protein
MVQIDRDALSPPVYLDETAIKRISPSVGQRLVFGAVVEQCCMKHTADGVFAVSGKKMQ